MGKIDEYLANILAARHGRDVRQSIHDAIKLGYDIAGIKFGTAVTSPTSPTGDFEEGAVYINTDTFQMWRVIGVNAWELMGSTRGTDGEDAPYITGVTLVSVVGDTKNYTFDLSDGTKYPFSVDDGKDGTDGEDAPKITGLTEVSHVGLVRTYALVLSDGSSYNFIVEDGQSGSGTGDMLKSVYDTNDNGIVDNAEKVGNAITSVLEGLNEDASGNLLYKTKKVSVEVDDALSLTSTNPVQNKKVTEALNGKTNKYTEESKILASDLWVGTEAPYTYDLGYDSTLDIELLLPNTASASMVEAVVNAQIAGNASDNLIRAWGEKPETDIQIIVRKVVK